MLPTVTPPCMTVGHFVAACRRYRPRSTEATTVEVCCLNVKPALPWSCCSHPRRGSASPRREGRLMSR